MLTARHSQALSLLAFLQNAGVEHLPYRVGEVRGMGPGGPEITKQYFPAYLPNTNPTEETCGPERCSDLPKVTQVCDPTPAH